MTSQTLQAKLEFRRMIKWIAVVGLLTVAVALVYLGLLDALSLHAVIATVCGVFFSVLLGCGLFALGFYSDKSGHDETVSGSTTPQESQDSNRP